MSIIKHIDRSISPFIEGIARTFDFAGAFDNIPIAEAGENPILNDWKAVASDYQLSVRIIEEELNGKSEKNKE